MELNGVRKLYLNLPQPVIQRWTTVRFINNKSELVLSENDAVFVYFKKPHRPHSFQHAANILSLENVQDWKAKVFWLSISSLQALLQLFKVVKIQRCLER